MSTRIITAFGKPARRRHNLAHDAWIALSATVFAIGILMLLTIVPASSVGAADEANATELVPGP